jgi:hypothetical protein
MRTFKEFNLIVNSAIGGKRKKSKNENRREKNFAYFMLFAVPIGTYVAKYIFFAVGNQGTLGLFGIVLLPLICIPIAVAIAFEISAIYYALYARDAIPAVGFVLLFVLAVWLPLPPLPPGDTENHFYSHRAEYEAVVPLAKSGQLPQNAPFHAHIEKQNPLVILFNPFDDFYNYIAYAQKREDLDQTDACYYDGGINSQIGDGWWLCFREWN